MASESLSCHAGLFVWSYVSCSINSRRRTCDRQTHRHSHNIYRASIASCGKKSQNYYCNNRTHVRMILLNSNTYAWDDFAHSPLVTITQIKEKKYNFVIHHSNTVTNLLNASDISLFSELTHQHCVRVGSRFNPKFPAAQQYPVTTVRNF